MRLGVLALAIGLALRPADIKAETCAPFGNYDINSAAGLSGLDPGYPEFRAMADVNGDQRQDFCRFVGLPGEEFLSCALATPEGGFGNLDFNSAPGLSGLDRGYPDFRVMADVNGDLRADYCRFVGARGEEFLSCALATPAGGFGNLDFNSGAGFSGLDPGYPVGNPNFPDYDHSGFRAMADVNGDGRADYCRFVGDRGEEFLSCALATSEGRFGNYDVNSAAGVSGLDPGSGNFRTMADVNGDGRADFCRFVGAQRDREYVLSCALATASGSFGNLDFNSARGFYGLDPGGPPILPDSPLPPEIYLWPAFRAMIDVNGDSRADFCRHVGATDREFEFLSCALATSGGGFGNYDINSARFSSGIDLGYGALLQAMADVNGDGRGDYCRFVGNPGQEFLSCALRLHVRREISKLDPAGSEIAALRRGVAAMQSRPALDATSWAWQAAIHGSWDAPQLGWNSCQHQSFFFLPWHRMYLYFFERILRDAAGDPELTLPYWNYTDPDQRSLPEAFRIPGDSSNPLWVSDRGNGINTGSKLPDAVVGYDSAFSFTNFSSAPGSSMSFGDQAVSGPLHSSRPSGQLENLFTP